MEKFEKEGATFGRVHRQIFAMTYPLPFGERIKVRGRLPLSLPSPQGGEGEFEGGRP